MSASNNRELQYWNKIPVKRGKIPQSREGHHIIYLAESNKLLLLGGMGYQRYSDLMFFDLSTIFYLIVIQIFFK